MAPNTCPIYDYVYTTIAYALAMVHNYHDMLSNYDGFVTRATSERYGFLFSTMIDRPLAIFADRVYELSEGFTFDDDTRLARSLVEYIDLHAYQMTNANTYVLKNKYCSPLFELVDDWFYMQRNDILEAADALDTLSYGNYIQEYEWLQSRRLINRRINALETFVERLYSGII